MASLSKRGKGGEEADLFGGDHDDQDAGASKNGKRVEVFWDDENEWYPGTVTAYDPEHASHQVTYDDGDVQWEDLQASSKVRWLDTGRTAAHRKHDCEEQV